MKERRRNERIQRSRSRYQIEMRRENPATGDMQVRLIGYSPTAAGAKAKARKYGSKLKTPAIFFIRDSEKDNEVAYSIQTGPFVDEGYPNLAARAYRAGR